MLLAIIPIIITLGPLLVAILMILNLTVSAGTINGLIFYANVIRAQHTMFFVPEIANSFLNKFIAWLNLDLGIESCFYDGLDAFTKTWLAIVPISNLYLAFGDNNNCFEPLLNKSV